MFIAAALATAFGLAFYNVGKSSNSEGMKGIGYILFFAGMGLLIGGIMFS